MLQFYIMLSIEEQYQHPHWQRRKNEIMTRDGWICQCCDATNTLLHVHHLYYEKDCHVWEYDDEALVTVCKNCHNKLHKDLKKLSGMIAFEILKKGLDVNDFKNMIYYGRK